MRLLLLISLVLAPAVGWAADPAEQVAARAQSAHEEYCAEVEAAKHEGDAARAIGEVSAVWADVAEVYEETGASWLLYWRGLLAQCIGQDERAAEALIGFLDSDPSASGMDAMVRDAQLRLRRLRPDYQPPRPERPPLSPAARRRNTRLGAGVGLVLGSAGAGVGSGVGFAQLSGTHDALTSSLLSTSQADGLIAQGDGQLAAGVGLALGAGVAAVASIAVFAGSQGGAELAVAAVPLRQGLGLVFGGRW